MCLCIINLYIYYHIFCLANHSKDNKASGRVLYIVKPIHIILWNFVEAQGWNFCSILLFTSVNTILLLQDLIFPWPFYFCTFTLSQTSKILTHQLPTIIYTVYHSRWCKETKPLLTSENQLQNADFTCQCLLSLSPHTWASTANTYGGFLSHTLTLRFSRLSWLV